MPCYSPNHCHKDGLNENGRMKIIWRGQNKGLERVEIPCGKCIGCKLEYSRNVATRCMLEASMHDDNSFVTLTYDDAKLPPGFDGNLSVKEHQCFMKRLRKNFSRPIKFYMAGEYGGLFGRPHYHYLLFGVDFLDKKLECTRDGERVYSSATLEQIWPYGFSSIGSVNFKSASYVARYCLKKVGQPVERVKDPESGLMYQVDKVSGECKIAEFTQMSRGGRTGRGIAYGWFQKYGLVDVFPSDEVIVNGKIQKPPRYFDKLLEKFDPDLYDSIKAERARYTRDWNEESDLRLRVKEQVKMAQIKVLQRPLGGLK